jgi:hypothetical protein
MVSNLEELSSSLRTVADSDNDEAQRLANKIKSDPRVQDELTRNGVAHVQDDAGKTFVVKRKAAAAAMTR